MAKLMSDPAGSVGRMDARPVRTVGEVAEAMKHAPRPTDDDVSITLDGRRLDTKEKVLEFLAEIEQARAEGRSLAAPLEPRSSDGGD